MSEFLDQFRPDPELDGRRVWRTAKPVLRAAVVAVATPYPDHPALAADEALWPTPDPSCPSARDPGPEVEVALYADGGNGFGAFHERAWGFIRAHPAAVEAALRRKLLAWHRKQMARFRDEDLPSLPEHQEYWKVVEQRVAMGEPAAVDQLFKLVRVGLADSGLDGCGFSSFEFQTG